MGCSHEESETPGEQAIDDESVVDPHFEFRNALETANAPETAKWLRLLSELNASEIATLADLFDPAGALENGSVAFDLPPGLHLRFVRGRRGRPRKDRFERMELYRYLGKKVLARKVEANCTLHEAIEYVAATEKAPDVTEATVRRAWRYLQTHRKKWGLVKGPKKGL